MYDMVRDFHFLKLTFFGKSFHTLLMPTGGNVNKHAGTYRMPGQAVSLGMAPVSICARIITLFAEFQQQIFL